MTSHLLLLLLQVYLNGQLLSVSAPKRIKKPSLFIRNVRQIGGAKLVALMSQMGCDRLRINDRTKDQLADLAVAFYNTEEAAFQALHKLKNIRIEGVKILASFRYVLCPSFSVFNVCV